MSIMDGKTRRLLSYKGGNDMDVICLDLEGVLIPEMWLGLAEKTGLKELQITTREEPDYVKLMHYRMDVLRKNHLTLKDIKEVVASMDPLEGAREFLDELRKDAQVVILSDTFAEYISPLIEKLGYPMILCNNLVIDDEGYIVDIRMRQEDGKRRAIDGFRSMNCRTFAAGDSYNDLSMIMKADSGCLFRAPENILEEYPDIPICRTYDEFLKVIRDFISEDK